MPDRLLYHSTWSLTLAPEAARAIGAVYLAVSAIFFLLFARIFYVFGYRPSRMPRGDGHSGGPHRKSKTSATELALVMLPFAASSCLFGLGVALSPDPHAGGPLLVTLCHRLGVPAHRSQCIPRLQNGGQAAVRHRRQVALARRPHVQVALPNGKPRAVGHSHCRRSCQRLCERPQHPRLEGTGNVMCRWGLRRGACSQCTCASLSTQTSFASSV